MIKWSLFHKKIPETGRVINVWEHNSWGNNLFWYDFDPVGTRNGKWRLGSHLSPKPKRGDEIRTKMQSGAIGRLIVADVEHVNSVHDMFYANCEPVDPFYIEGSETRP